MTAASLRPANSQVSRARCIGLTKTRERLLGEHRAQPFGEPTLVIGQGHIRCARMLTAQAPRRLAMPDHKHVHVPIPLFRCGRSGSNKFPGPDHLYQSYIGIISVVAPFAAMQRSTNARRYRLHLVRVLPETGRTVAAGPQV